MNEMHLHEALSVFCAQSELKKWLQLGGVLFMDNSSAKPATGGVFQQQMQQTSFSFEALNAHLCVTLQRTVGTCGTSPSRVKYSIGILK